MSQRSKIILVAAAALTLLAAIYYGMATRLAPPVAVGGDNPLAPNASYPPADDMFVQPPPPSAVGDNQLKLNQAYPPAGELFPPPTGEGAP
jgi:hypothetical protein